jgi:tetratricopeptide (TPR) repeat protein
MADSPDSLQAIILQRQHAGFVGREAWLALFRDNFALPANDMRHKFLFAIHGDGGVGKTFLIKRMSEVSAERGWLTATTDETAYGVVEAMAVISGQLNEQGARLKRFEQQYARYRKRQHELERGLSAGDDAASLVTKTVVRMGVGAARSLPGGGVVTEFIDPAATAESTDRLRAAITKKLRSRDDVRLVLSPIEELTKVFVEGLRQLSKPAALFFDTYERTSSFLDRWLRDLFSNVYGPLPMDLVITVAGRSALDSGKWSAFLKVVQDVPLVPFTNMEVRQLLEAEGVTDEYVVTVILKDSGGLPLAVAMLAENQPSGEWTPNDVSATVVERFLQWEDNPARREIALAAALPRHADEDVVAVLTDTADAAELYEWLTYQPFVTMSAGRCQYHEVVREPMIRLYRGRSRHRWRELHNTLASSYQRWREQLGQDEGEGWSDPSWQAYMTEETYHRLCADPLAALPYALDQAVEACRREVTVALRWSAMIAQAGRDADAVDVAALGMRLQDALSADEGGEIRFLDEILRESRLGTVTRANTYRERGRQHRLAGHYDEALADFNRAIDLKPQYSDAFSGRGETYRLMGRYEEALADFNRAIDLSSKLGSRDEWAIASRGETYHSMGRYEEALADFNRVIDLDPESAYYIASRGETYHSMGRYEEALADFNRAIDLDPEYGWAIASRGQTYRLLERYEEALADFNRAIDLNPESAYYIARRGETYRLMERYEQALADFNRAIDLNPEYEWAIASRGQTYRLMERYEEALADFNRAIDLDPEAAWIIAERARTHRAIGRHDQAVADFDRAIDLNPMEPGYVMERALTSGFDRGGMGRFQLIADVEATPETAAQLAQMITDWLVSAGIMEPERTACVPGQYGGHAPGPSRNEVVAELFSANDMPDRLSGVLLSTGRSFCHPMTINAAICPSCGRSITLRRNGQLATAWERIIDAIALWEDGGVGTLRCPICANGAHVSDWQFNPPCVFTHLILLFWNWPPLTNSFVSDVSHKLSHRVVVITGNM